PLGAPANVDHGSIAGLERAGNVVEIGLRYLTKLSTWRGPGVERRGVEGPGHAIEPNHRQIADRVLEAMPFAALDQQVEIGVVGEEPTGPGGERRVERDAE